METFNAGDVGQYYQDVQNFDQQITNVSVLNENRNVMEEKIKIMAFMELIFGLETNDRAVTFQQIAQRANMEVNQVEFMVLRAMS